MNKELTNIDIMAIAELAKIKLDAEQAEHMKNDIAQFIEFAQILSDFEIDELSYAANNDSFREDDESENKYSVEVLTTPSRISNGYISVPLTVEENEE